MVAITTIMNDKFKNKTGGHKKKSSVGGASVIGGERRYREFREFNGVMRHFMKGDHMKSITTDELSVNDCVKVEKIPDDLLVYNIDGLGKNPDNKLANFMNVLVSKQKLRKGYNTQIDSDKRNWRNLSKECLEGLDYDKLLKVYSGDQETAQQINKSWPKSLYENSKQQEENAKVDFFEFK